MAILCCSWVRSVAFDPSNEWFATGSADRTIKIWDTASGQLKLTLTGHIEQVTGLGVSARHPYMFSCGLDKMVKCWDLEQNKVGTAEVAQCMCTAGAACACDMLAAFATPCVVSLHQPLAGALRTVTCAAGLCR